MKSSVACCHCRTPMRLLPGRRVALTALSLVVLASAGAVGAEAEAAPPSSGKTVAPFPADQMEFFEAKIRPMLVEHCYECHSGEASTLQAGLRLDHREGLLQGGDSGAAVELDDAEESLLLRVLEYGDDYPQMPPEGPLSAEVIADVRRWIEMGLPDPRSEHSSEAALAAPAEGWRDHWAFQPLERPPVDGPSHPLARTELDRHIMGRQQQAGITPAPPADPRTLIRRVTYDLTGLPPAAEAIDRLIDHWSPEAYVEYVDKLLSSPQFGERWARHWMDVMRYADTKGYVFQEDRNYPDAYRYRQWLIQSLNDDMPYDRFIHLQLAADQLTEEEDPNRIALGYVTLGRRFLNNRYDIIDDRIDVVCRGLMGLTVSCARCHDHKYDPIPTADYYSLFGVFASSRTDSKESLILLDRDDPSDAPILVRGSPGNRGEVVPRQFLEALSPEDRVPFQHGSGRLELAQAITDPTNPLTARVFVNRVWGHLFGSYLVETPSDFGMRSEPPVLPEALDHLAWEFIESGWSRKHLIRSIVLSHVYCQSSDDRPDARAIDPENRLYWAMNRRRLDFESMRDSLMYVAGRLQLEPIGGPSVHIETAPYPMRRTVYAFIDRQNLPGLFRTFDLANPDTHAPRRAETVVPQQGLFLMNNPFTMQMAEAAAAQTAGENDVSARVVALYRRVLGRTPSDEELSWTVGFLQAEEEQTAAESLDAQMQSPWSYGYGSIDEATGTVRQFLPLPHWTGSSYQGSEELPDPQLGWVMLNAEGGHPGHGPDRAVIRRWTAPADGKLRITGRLQHRSAEGDGVRGRVVLGNGPALWTGTVHNREEDTRLEDVVVATGQTVDFVVDALSNESHDSFQWQVRITLQTEPRGRIRDSSNRSFGGPPPRPLDAWGRLAQVLMLSNEFATLD